MEYLIEYTDYKDYRASLCKIIDKVDKIDYISSSSIKDLEKLGLSVNNLEKYLGFIEESIYIKNNIDQDLITDLFFDIRDDFNYIDISSVSYSIEVTCDKHKWDEFNATYFMKLPNQDLGVEKPTDILTQCFDKMFDSMNAKKDYKKGFRDKFSKRDHNYYKFNDFSEYVNFLNFSFVINITLNKIRDINDNNDFINDTGYDAMMTHQKFREDISKRILHMYSVAIRDIGINKEIVYQNTYGSTYYPSFKLIIK